MLYIHNLDKLNPKSADIEIVPILRQLKSKKEFSEKSVQERFQPQHISEEDLQLIRHGFVLIQPTFDALTIIDNAKDKQFEVINLERSLQVLSELPGPYEKNIAFFQDIAGFQNQAAEELFAVLSRLQSFKEGEEGEVNAAINAVFRRLLRGDDFTFVFKDILYEAQRDHAQGLAKSMREAFLIHVPLELSLKHPSVAQIRAQLPQEKLKVIDMLSDNAQAIALGVERAYACNLRMIEWSILIYAYVKWRNNP
jgi:hypothetical protein